MNTSRSESHLTDTRRLAVGARVVLRYRDSDGQLTDALGDLVAYDEEAAVVRTRRGDVRVARSAVVTGKEVPPKPARPGRPHRVIGIADLQELMVGGMPPLESAWLGRWLLRAARGYTGRGNSVLPLGDPGTDVDAALDQVVQWYAQRRQPPLVQLTGELHAAIDATEIGASVIGRGWQVFQHTLVLTASTEGLLDTLAEADSTRVDLSSTVDERWILGAGQRENAHAATLLGILSRVRDARYATIGDGQRPDAVGRVALSPGWSGLFGLHVAPEQRRQGHGRALMAALALASLDAGARSTYLQVSADNDAALDLYRAVGFEVHHAYYYARPTSSGRS